MRELQVGETSQRRAIANGRRLRAALEQNRAAFVDKSYEEISREFGLSEQTVKHVCRLNGLRFVKPRKPIHRVSVQRSRAMALVQNWAGGDCPLTYVELAKECGASYDAVRHACKRLKVAVKHVERKRFPADFATEREMFFGELERDDEYFDVVCRNHGLGVSLSGEYWKRYRSMLALKIRGEVNL